MRMKLNQKCPPGASGHGVIDSRAQLREIVELADNLSIDVSKAVCAADLAFRHAQDSKITNGTEDGKGNEIYFPPHERKILGFIIDDVAVRLSELDKMADELSTSLMNFHELMRGANSTASQAKVTQLAPQGMSLTANIDRFRFYCERFASTDYQTVEDTKAGCIATWRPWFDVLLAWDTPAASFNEAIAALRLVDDELKENQESPLAKSMIRAALSYFESNGGAA